MKKNTYFVSIIILFWSCTESTPHTPQLQPNRIRFLNPYQFYETEKPFIQGDSFLLREQHSWKLLDTLGFCIGHLTQGKEQNVPHNYHLPLDSCGETEDMNYFRMYRVEHPKANPLLVVETFEGDDGERVSRNSGCLFLFERNLSQWQLRDIIFGNLTAVDIDSIGNWMPILFGKTQKWMEDAKTQTQDSIKDYWVEIRYHWDGRHWQANEVISCGNFYMGGDSLDIPKMKKAHLYTPLYQKYVQNDNEIYKGVKLHSKFRSFSLAHRKDPYYKDATFVQKRWRKGFRMD